MSESDLPCAIDCRDHDHRRCRGALNLLGEHFWCDLNAGHVGLAHSNADAQAIWKSDEI